MLGAPITAGNSDSQDLNRTIDTLIRRQGLSLAEAMELVVPPIANEIRTLSPDLHPFYMFLRQAFGPFAQGPVALIARFGDECVFSADALGLRPLWALESSDDFVFSSEPGVVAIKEMVSEPKPMAPGEKFMVSIDRDRKRSTRVPHAKIVHVVRDRWLARVGAASVAPCNDRALFTGGPPEGIEFEGRQAAGPSDPVKVSDKFLAGFGWNRDDAKLVQQMASNGAEPIGSLGYDGPLAVLSTERHNLADFFKETVAVVTNPAIDREREMEHFRPAQSSAAGPRSITRPRTRTRSRPRFRLSSAAITGSRRSQTRSCGGLPTSIRPGCSRTSGSISEEPATAGRPRSTSPCSRPRTLAAGSSGSSRSRFRWSHPAPSCSS